MPRLRRNRQHSVAIRSVIGVKRTVRFVILGPNLAITRSQRGCSERGTGNQSILVTAVWRFATSLLNAPPARTSPHTMFWISWIACSIVLAALFSIVKTIESMSPSVD